MRLLDGRRAQFDSRRDPERTRAFVWELLCISRSCLTVNASYFIAVVFRVSVAKALAIS